jgi:hypothetical protein
MKLASALAVICGNQKSASSPRCKPRELNPSPLDLLLKTFAAPAMTIELALQFINLSPDP